uniref:CWC15 protein n=1 Tax=Steinernema glaseri TaxID=37863 RepID=A0A1I7Y0U0_9BILA
MTTAHRPTFDTARGGSGRAEGDLSKLSQQYSSKDMPSHMTLKYRQKGQGTAEDIRVRDLRRELEDKEREHQKEKEAKDRKTRGRAADDDETSSKKLKIEAAPTASTAADEDDPWNDGDDDDSDSDSDDDESALLMAELARIRKERATEKAEKEAQEKEEQERVRFENILQGNPLLQHESKEPAGSTEFKVKRRWDDDVVFKNCAKGLDERQKEPTFINDAIRSEFHRKFMDKYIK